MKMVISLRCQREQDSNHIEDHTQNFKSDTEQLMSYDFNAEAERIASWLIDKYHPHLIGVKIAYITKTSTADLAGKAPRSGKTLKLGSASLLSEKYQLLAEKDYAFVIEVNGAYWNRLELKQQYALIDHELCHCVKDGDGYYLADHSVEEFRPILRRHGFWKPDIQAFCEEAQPLFEAPGIQMRLQSPPPDAGDTVVSSGELVRIEETGELWAFNVRQGKWIPQIPEDAAVQCGVPGCGGELVRHNALPEQPRLEDDPLNKCEDFPVYQCSKCRSLHDQLFVYELMRAAGVTQ